MSSLFREQADRGPSSMYHIYGALYKYDKKKDKSVKNVPKSKLNVIGMVADDKMPKEGEKFVMYYHRYGNTASFGSLLLKRCVNVIKQDDCYYFEDPDSLGRYILMPCELN